ncbi:MAG: hypothetical protein AB1403_12950 [Candidatus Riflebacteria bacterium]
MISVIMDAFKKILICAIVLLLLWGGKTLFFPPSENEKIERMLHQAAEDFAAKKLKSVSLLLSDDFSSLPKGDKEMAEMQMKAFFFQVRDLSASIEYLKHENEKLPSVATEARVLAVVKVSGTIDGARFQAFGSHGADAVVLTLRKQNEEWRVFRARYLDTKDPMTAFRELVNGN